MKKILLITLLISVLFVACKSDTSIPSFDVTGKWTLAKIRLKSSNSSLNKDTTQPFLAGSYSNFGNDGKVYSYLGLYDSLGFMRDTAKYSVKDNILTKISLTLLDTSKITIQNQTAKSMLTYQIENIGSSVKETWLTYSR
jgi:uncharacterized protein YcfL